MGGKYGQGVVVKSYIADTIISVDVFIHKNHMGYFKFDLCNAKNGESEECFAQNRLKTEKGEDTWKLPPGDDRIFTVNLQLPKGLECDHCVLRWIYVCGNSWGNCENGTEGMGCGPQEHFLSCSDITIKKSFVRDEPNWSEVCQSNKDTVDEIIKYYKEKSLKD